MRSPDGATGDDLRRNKPRFSVENCKLVSLFASALEAIARRHGVDVGEVVIAWTLAQPGEIAGDVSDMGGAGLLRLPETVYDDALLDANGLAQTMPRRGYIRLAFDGKPRAP